MVSQAEEIRDLLFNNWQFDNTETDPNLMRISKIPLDTQRTPTPDAFNMAEIVYFYDRKQVEGNEQTKAITVEKINDEFEQNNTFHPSFTEVQDYYEITLFYRATDVQQTEFSNALTDIENMATEVIRILKTKYDPSTSTGPFYLTSYRWDKSNMTDQAQPELVHRLYLTLTTLKGFSDDVFSGYGGVLIFKSNPPTVIADNPPAGDYEYLGLSNLLLEEGFEQIPYLTKDVSRGRGVPYLQRGKYRGTFTASIYATTSDLNGSTADKLYNIWKTQNNSPRIGQNIEVTMLHSNTNTKELPAGTPNPDTLNMTSEMIINNMSKHQDDKGLVIFDMKGQMVRPTTVSVVVST